MAKSKLWSDEEIVILHQYEKTNKSAFVLYQECRKAGYNRTYKAVTRKIESLGFRKPKRYVNWSRKDNWILRYRIYWI
jgi:hypothetical protein